MMRLLAAVLLALSIATRIKASLRDNAAGEIETCPSFSQSIPGRRSCDNKPITAFRRSLTPSLQDESITLRRRGSDDEGEDEGTFIAAPSWKEFAHKPSLRDWTSFSEAVPVPPPSHDNADASSSQSQPKEGRRRVFGLLGRALSSKSKVNNADDSTSSRRKTTPLIVGNYVVNHEAPYPGYGRQPQTLTQAASDGASDSQTDHRAQSPMSDVDKLLEAQKAFTKEDLERWLQDQTLSTGEEEEEEEMAYQATEERRRRSRLKALKIHDNEGKGEGMDLVKESPLSSHDSTTIIMNPPEVTQFEEDIFYSTPETDIHRGSSSKLTSTMKKPRSKEKYKPRSISLAELRRRKQRKEERRLQEGVMDDEPIERVRSLPGRAKIYNAFQRGTSSISSAERNKIKAEVMRSVVSGFSGIKDRLSKAVSQYTSSASDSDTASTPASKQYEGYSRSGGKSVAQFDKRSSQLQSSRYAECAFNEGNRASPLDYHDNDGSRLSWQSDGAPLVASMSRNDNEGNLTNDYAMTASGDPFGEPEDFPDASQLFDKVTQCCCPPYAIVDDDDVFSSRIDAVEHQEADRSESTSPTQRRLVKRSPISPSDSYLDDKIDSKAVSMDKRGFTDHPLELAAHAEKSNRGLMAEKYLLYKDISTQGRVSRAWNRYLAQPVLQVPEGKVTRSKGSSGNDHGDVSTGRQSRDHGDSMGGDHKDDDLPEVSKKPLPYQKTEEDLFKNQENLWLSLENRKDQLYEGLDPEMIQQRDEIRRKIREEENKKLNDIYADLMQKEKEAEAIPELAEAPNEHKTTSQDSVSNDESSTSHPPTNQGHQPDHFDARDYEIRSKEADEWAQKYLTRHNLWPPGHQAGADTHQITPQMEADLAKELEKLEGLHAGPSTSNPKQIDLKKAESEFREYLKKNHIVPPKPIFTNEQAFHEHLASQYGLSLDKLNQRHPQIPPIVQASSQIVQQAPQSQHHDKLFDVLDEYSRKDQPK